MLSPPIAEVLALRAVATDSRIEAGQETVAHVAQSLPRNAWPLQPPERVPSGILIGLLKRVLYIHLTTAKPAGICPDRGEWEMELQAL